MSATGAGYDLSPTTFSPDGKVFQVEYAAKAVEQSGTAVGIRCKDGVVLAVEKKVISKMLVKGSNRRIATVDTHAGLLVNKGREEATNYKSFYGSQIPGNVLADRLAGHVHMHTLYWYLRPFGASVLLAAYDEAPELYMIEPSGVCYRYFGVAIGKNRAPIKTELEKFRTREIMEKKTLTCREAVFELAKMIYYLHDEAKDKQFELEMSWVCDETGKKHVLIPDSLRDEAIKAAIDHKKKADEASDDDEKMAPAEEGKKA